MNILLSFLSFVRFNKDKTVQEIEYAQIDSQDHLGKTHTTNESALRYVLQDIPKGEKLDAYVALVSELVKKDPAGDTGKKHLQYIQDRTNEILNKACYVDKKPKREVFEPISYNEGASSEASIKTVMDAISKIVSVTNNEKLNLYVDITGGLRDANMLLLITSRILEHLDNVTVKDIIYSKLNSSFTEGTIEHRKRIFDLLTLVAGVEEFVTFGSVRSLEKYFATVKEDITPEIAAAVIAMKNFSEKIQLCRSTDFDEAIDELDKALKSFGEHYKSKPESERNMTEKLFAGLYRNITEKYAELFAEGKSDRYKKVSQFRWCLDNGYLQQAMTLITEQAPLVFFAKERPLLQFCNEAKQDELLQMWDVAEKGKKGDKLDFPNWLMFRYSYTEKGKEFETKRKALIEELKEVSTKKEFNEQKGSEFISKLIEIKNDEILAKKQQSNKHGKGNDLPYEDLGKAIKGINALIKSNFLEKIASGKFQKIKMEEIDGLLKNFLERAQWIGYIDNERLLANLKLFLEWYIAPDSYKGPELPIIEYIKGNYHPKEGAGIREKNKFVNDMINSKQSHMKAYNGSYANMFGVPFMTYPSNARTMLNMFRYNVLKSDVPDIIRQVVSYYEIKDERNAANHANINRDNSTDYNELRNKIDNFIKALELS